MWHSADVRLIRAFDGIVYATLALIICLMHPALGRDALGELHPFCGLPVVVVAWCSFQFPDRAAADQTWPALVAKLRWIGLLFAGFMPGALYATRQPDSLYLQLNLFAAMAAAIGFYLHLALLVKSLAAHDEHQLLMRIAQTARALLFWLLGAPFVAVSGVLIAHLARHGQPADLHLLLQREPMLAVVARLAVVVPSFAAIGTVLLGRLLLLQRLAQRASPAES